MLHIELCGNQFGFTWRLLQNDVPIARSYLKNMSRPQAVDDAKAFLLAMSNRQHYVAII